MKNIELLQERHRKYFHELPTRRTVLRPLTMEDVPAMFEYTSVPENFCYLRRTAHISMNEDKAFIENVINGYREHREFVWGIEYRENAKLIGTCRLFNVDDDEKSCEVSYILHPDYQGRGLVAEAVKVLVNYVFTEWRFSSLVARCLVENSKSERVMLAAGMQYDGTYREYSEFNKKECTYKKYVISKL